MNKINITSATFKSALISIIALMLFFVFWFAMRRVHVTDPVPQIIPITTNVIKELGTFAVKVRTGLFIKNFPEFEIIKNNFIIDSVLWFEFNADEITIDSIGKFSFDRGSILSKAPPEIKLIDNKIFAKYNVVFNIKSELNYHKFPFEDHRVAIIISNNFVTPQEMYFFVDGSSFQIAKNIFPANWKLQDLNVDAGYVRHELDQQDKTKKAEHPKALFMINIVKASARKILVIFLPLFSAMFLSFFSFVMNIANVVGKFSLAISAITALLGYRFVIEQMMPPTGYFTTTDEIYLFLLILSFLIFIFQLLLTRLYMLRADPKAEENKNISAKFPPEKLEKINAYGFIITAILFIVITSYIILK